MGFKEIISKTITTVYGINVLYIIMIFISWKIVSLYRIYLKYSDNFVPLFNTGVPPFLAFISSQNRWVKNGRLKGCGSMCPVDVI